MVANEGSDNEGDQTVGTDDEAVARGRGSLHFSNPGHVEARRSTGARRDRLLPWVERREETDGEG